MPGSQLVPRAILIFRTAKKKRQESRRYLNIVVVSSADAVLWVSVSTSTTAGVVLSSSIFGIESAERAGSNAASDCGM